LSKSKAGAKNAGSRIAKACVEAFLKTRSNATRRTKMAKKQTGKKAKLKTAKQKSKSQSQSRSQNFEKIGAADFKSDTDDIKNSFGDAKEQIGLLLNAIGVISQGIKFLRGSDKASPSSLAKNATAIAEKNPKAGLFTAAGVTLALAGLLFYRSRMESAAAI
jgi:hypothetical protein